jgi:hypothetical protein
VVFGLPACEAGDAEMNVSVMSRSVEGMGWLTRLWWYQEVADL